MIPRRMSLLEVRMSCTLVHLQVCPNVAHEDAAVLVECCPFGRDSSLNLLVLVFFSGAICLFQVDVAFNDLSVGDIYWCVIFHHYLRFRLVHLHFYQVIPVAFVVAHLVY